MEEDKKYISHIRIEGYKSIKHCDVELRKLNILIGANGAGKSNFISFFKLLREIVKGNLQNYVSKQGGSNNFLHFGSKRTQEIKAKIDFKKNYYSFILLSSQNALIFDKQQINSNDRNFIDTNRKMNESCFSIPNIMENTMLNNTSSIEDLKNFAGEDVYNLVSNIMNCITYHFHDTSENASLKQRHAINDNLYLRDDASNLAAYLYFLSKKYPKNFIRIVKTIQLVAPFFGEFLLRPHIDNEDYIELEWFEKGEDIPFKIDVLSDGTLRFICLATLFLQPVELQPAIIIIDEPELGLHPYALSILAGLIKSASQDRQIIVSTQSVELLNHFSASDVIVAEKHDGCTKLKRLNENDLNIWLEDYSLGELWCKNILGGRPTK